MPTGGLVEIAKKKWDPIWTSLDREHLERKLTTRPYQAKSELRRVYISREKDKERMVGDGR